MLEDPKGVTVTPGQAGRVLTWRGLSVGGRTINKGKGFIANLTTPKRAGTTGSWILKEVDTETEAQRKRGKEKTGRKGIETKRGCGFHIAIRTLKANAHEKVEILKRRMFLEVKSTFTRKRERKVGNGQGSKTMKRTEKGITKTGTQVIGVKAKGERKKK